MKEPFRLVAAATCNFGWRQWFIASPKKMQ